MSVVTWRGEACIDIRIRPGRTDRHPLDSVKRRSHCRQHGYIWRHQAFVWVNTSFLLNILRDVIHDTIIILSFASCVRQYRQNTSLVFRLPLCTLKSLKSYDVQFMSLLRGFFDIRDKHFPNNYLRICMYGQQHAKRSTPYMKSPTCKA